MPVIPIRLKPTFPLDATKIRKLKREAIWRSPRKLAIRALANVSRMLIPTSDFSTDMRDAWSEIDDELTARVMQDMIQESNVGQDEEIRKLMRNLNGVGKWQYAISLSKILLLKQHIESDLHRSGHLNERKKEIEILVDSLCQEVCQEIYEIANISDNLAKILTSGDEERLTEMSGRVSRGHLRIMKSYATLSGTAGKLTAALEPGTERPDSSARQISELDRLINVLREENEVAEVVDQRIREELPPL